MILQLPAAAKVAERRATQLDPVREAIAVLKEKMEEARGNKMK